MSKSKAKLTIGNLHDSNAWPEALKVAFDAFVDAGGKGGSTHVILAICVDIENKQMSAVFSPAASMNPHKVDMCKSMSEMFQDMAKRLSQ